MKPLLVLYLCALAIYGAVLGEVLASLAGVSEKPALHQIDPYN